jgi:hypothetical protein
MRGDTARVRLLAEPGARARDAAAGLQLCVRRYRYHGRAVV